MVRALPISALTASACLVLSCGSTPEVGLCVRTATDDPDPLGQEGVTSLVLRATPVEGVPEQRFFAPGTGTLRLPELAWGTWQFVVQALGRDDAILATGATPLVEVNDDQAELPCVYVATVGSFGETVNAPPAHAPRLAFGATGSTSALVATDAGLVRYDHVAGTFADPIALPFDPTGAIWAALGDGRAAAILPDRRAAILTADGAVESMDVVVDAAIGDLDGATAIGIGISSVSVLVVGGAADADTVPSGVGSLRVVDVSTGAVTQAESTSGLAVRDARVEPLGGFQFLVVGNNAESASAPVASNLIAIVDPTQNAPDGPILFRTDLATARLDPIVSVSGSNVLVLGGRDDAGSPLATVEHFRIGQNRIAVAPAVDDLLHPRAGGLALRTPQGIVLLGATQDDGTAERVSFDDAPRLCAPANQGGTGCDYPGVPLDSPVSVGLHDESILVVGNGAAAVYRP